MSHRVRTQLGIGYVPPGPLVAHAAREFEEEHPVPPMEVAARIPRPSGPPPGVAFDDQVVVPMHPARVKYALFAAAILSVLLGVTIFLGVGKRSEPVPVPAATPVVAAPLVTPRPAPEAAPAAPAALASAHPPSHVTVHAAAKHATATHSSVPPTKHVVKGTSKNPALDLKVPKAMPAAQKPVSKAAQFGTHYGSN